MNIISENRAKLVKTLCEHNKLIKKLKGLTNQLGVYNENEIVDYEEVIKSNNILIEELVKVNKKLMRIYKDLVKE